MLLVRVEERVEERVDATVAASAVDVTVAGAIAEAGIVADGIGIVVVSVVWIVERLGMLSRADATLGWMRCGRGLLLVELVRRRVTMSLWI